MYTYNGDYPLVGILIPDKTNPNERIPFKYKMLEDTTQFFTTSGGLMDSGIAMSIVTPKKIDYVEGAKIIIEGIKYSISGITVRIPDKAIGMTIRRKINAEYIIGLV